MPTQLENLKQISKKYEALKTEALKEMNTYFENHNGQEFVIENSSLPKFRQIEIESEKKVEKFVKTAKQFGKINKLTDKELIINVSNQVLQNKNNINMFLLINLMWNIEEENVFCTKTLESLIRKNLEVENIGSQEEYYLESLIDIWHYEANELVPIDILESIILLDSKSMENCYGAIIKSVSYLSDHPQEKIVKVLSKARKTKKYKEDEYYREWIN